MRKSVMANTRQKLAGGAVIGVAALAFYLGTQWKGPGLGGTGTGFGTTANGTGEGEAPAAAELVGDDAAPVASREASGGGTPHQILRVVVSGDDYLISTTDESNPSKVADLSEVAHAALVATGDPQGIRVRVQTKKDATAGAMDDLRRKLDQVGIPIEGVQFLETPLD